jgi:hypothetical protein
VIGRLEALEGRVIRRQVRQAVVEVDVVAALVNEGGALEDRQDLGDAPLERPRAHEALQVEQPTHREPTPAGRGQGPALRAVRVVEGKGLEIEHLLHGRHPQLSRIGPIYCQEIFPST